MAGAMIECFTLIVFVQIEHSIYKEAGCAIYKRYQKGCDHEQNARNCKWDLGHIVWRYKDIMIIRPKHTRREN